ncbi:hypothetical protein [Pseudomonas sp. MWU12-2323]|uniref:hypothetical protein n=1 Tax=Pseudomonas sp. MWU12-2323 TaxID=2651296 RepID=UPI00128CFC93|nr:hypothetical protein [Pseudomonas sp. MWU12-2323]MPQ69326.1 hypothetical protein [Pseudomonas sp. MWU12-2323]
MTTSDEHHRLTKQGASWLRKNGFGVVATELTCFGSREQPDVVGFRSDCSALVEVKVSRADFLADQKKPERSTSGGIGIYRFYLCPEGLIRPEDLPAKWGLLYAKGRSVVAVVKPQGNLWPPLEKQPPAAEAPIGDWREFQHVPDARAERSALYSIARRLAAGAAI